MSNTMLRELREAIESDEMGTRLTDAMKDNVALDIVFTIIRVLGETSQREIESMPIGDKSHWASILVDVYLSKRTLPEATQEYAKCILRRLFWGEFIIHDEAKEQ